MNTYHVVLLIVIDDNPSVKAVSLNFDTYHELVRFVQASGHGLLAIEDSKIEAESTAYKIIKAFETLDYLQGQAS